jgi:hypothetical protein
MANTIASFVMLPFVVGALAAVAYLPIRILYDIVRLIWRRGGTP